MIVLMAGLPGTGKTTLARELARRTSGRVLSKDEFRHALFATEEIEYSTRQDDFCQELMLCTAGYLLSRDPKKIVFVDGRPFSRQYQIENAISVADSIQQPWRILECACPEELARQRLESDTLERSHPAANRSWKLYLEVRARFEAIRHPKAIIDTSRPPSECAEYALAALRAPTEKS